MFKKIKDSISYLCSIGIHSELSANLAEKVRMSNSAALIGSLINLFFLFLALFIYDPKPIVFFLILTVLLIEISIIILNAFFSPRIVFYYIIISMSLPFAGLKIFYVNNWGEQFIFLIVIYLIFLLFEERRKQFFSVLIIVSIYLIAEIIHQSLPNEMIGSIFKTKDSRVYLFLNYVLWLSFLINLFHKRTMKASDEQEKLLVKLQKQKIEIQKVSKEVERFNHIASHDLKSPLRNIISFIGLTKAKIKREQYEEIPEHLDFIENATEQMNALIDDILIFSDINEKNISTAKVDINDLIHDVILELDDFLKEKSAHILFNTLPSIDINYKTVKTVFLNFIKNAILYNQSPHPTVEVAYSVDNQYHTFSFKDNGIGIPKEFQDQVFEYFKRLHTYENYKGSGLGLGICKKIVEKMNGKLSLDSEVGKGSTFKIQLPFHHHSENINN